MRRNLRRGRMIVLCAGISPPFCLLRLGVLYLMKYDAWHYSGRLQTEIIRLA